MRGTLWQMQVSSARLSQFARHRFTAVIIDYELTDGDVSEEVCYWKDMIVAPHLINLWRMMKHTVFGSLERVPGPGHHHHKH